MNYYISNPYLPTHQIQNTQITPINTSHILLKYSPCHWAPTNILYTQAHKLPWALSQILPIIAHILSNLGFHKKYSPYHYQNWATKLHYLHKEPKIILLVGKTQREPKLPKVPLRCGKFKSPTTMQLIQCPTTMWQIQKPTSTWQIQSPLQCDNIYKAHYDAALLTKPVATRHL